MYIIVVGLEYGSESREREAVAEKQNVLIIDSGPERNRCTTLIGNGATAK